MLSLLSSQHFRIPRTFSVDTVAARRVGLEKKKAFVNTSMLSARLQMHILILIGTENYQKTYRILVHPKWGGFSKTYGLYIRVI